MMFSQTVEYILRVVVYLAAQEHNASTTHQISAATHVPIGYLAKIMQRLVKAGLVTSQRGRNGGFLLAPSAYALTLYDIVQSLEPLARVSRCPLHLPQHEGRLCALHARLDRAIEAAAVTLREPTIAGLVAQIGDCSGIAGAMPAASVPAGATAVLN